MLGQPHIGLIGCGNWGRHILRDLREIGCAVSVVARSGASERRASAGGAINILNSLEELPDVDGIVVVTPSATHAEIIRQVIDRRVPIYTEKPLTTDVASAVELSEKAPDHLFVMDKWRYHPGILMLAEIARSKELGPVIGLRSTRAGWGNPHDDADCTWHLTPHDISIALEILGYIPEPKSAIVEYDGQSITSMTALLGDSATHVIEVSTRYPDRRREVRLQCRDGVAVLGDGYAEHVAITRIVDPNDKTIPAPELRPISKEMPLLLELKAFVDHIKGGPAPNSSAAEGAAIVKTIAKLRELAGISSA